MILYLIYSFCMVTCTVSLLSRFTAHLLPVYLIVRIFHFCRNENFRYTNEGVGVFLVRHSVQHLAMLKIKIFLFRNMLYISFTNMPHATSSLRSLV
jgi:hypothetical protein